jgi:hypothetical protein
MDGGDFDLDLDFCIQLPIYIIPPVSSSHEITAAAAAAAQKHCPEDGKSFGSPKIFVFTL